MQDSVALYQREQALIKGLIAQHPDAFTPQRNFSAEQILDHVGIRVDFGQRPQGYLNLYHQDFVVEEVGLDGTVSTIEPGIEPSRLARTDQPILYADLVKVGLSTLEAASALARAIAVPENRIHYAGMKDKMAITSQRIAISGAEAGPVADLTVSGMFLKNFSCGNRKMTKGDLRANRFSIVIRTAEPVEPAWLDERLSRWQDGFYNFYYLQRFGTPRLLSHLLGKLILLGDFGGVVRHFLTQRGAQDVPFLNRIRQAAGQQFGAWPLLQELFQQLPYTFRLELRLVNYLADHPDDFHGALIGIADQMKMWVYAYASYLFNLHLSFLIASDQPLPKFVPLLLHPQYASITTYAQQLLADGITELERAVPNALGRQIMSAQNICSPVAAARILQTKIIDGGAIIAFELPPGSYATTFLSHVFSLYHGLPLPDWLNRARYDSKAELGSGSVAAAEKVLEKYIFGQADHLTE